MPISFLTTKEREHYQQIPQDIQEQHLRRFFFMSREDKAFVQTFNGDITKIAIALQIGILRFLGYLPEDWTLQSKEYLINFVSASLSLLPISFSSLQEYGNRQATRSSHLQQILKYLKFQKWQPLIDEPILEKWLIEHGMEHANERYLLALLCQKLRQDKILRPSIGTMEALVGGIREQLEAETYQRLSFLWTEEFLKKLDNILEVDSLRKMTIHRWLCKIPSTNTAKEINQTLEKIDYLVEIGAKTWDLSVIPANRQKCLANAVRTDSNAHLKRLNSTRRYPMLVCFLRESLLDTTDVILAMYTDYWQQMTNKAKKSLDIYLLETAKSQQQAIKTVTQMGKMVVDETIGKEQLRDTIYENLPKEHIQDAIQTLTDKQSKTTSHLSFLKNYYPSMKQFTSNLLSKLDFKVAFTKDNFETALTLVKDLQ